MKIFGQVLDVDGSPMGLANITITTGANALKMGEQADLDGNFVLEDASISADSEFKISYVGYKPQFFKASLPFCLFHVNFRTLTAFLCISRVILFFFIV